MGKIRRVLRCHNCGAILQSDDEMAPGYISKEILEGTSPRIPYCNSCYEKMLEFNATGLNDNTDYAVMKILDDAVATDALIVWVVDLFSFNGTLNKDVIEKIRKLNVAVVGTKRDLFSSGIDDETFVRFILERFHEYGVTPVCIRLVGNNTPFHFNEIYKSLNDQRKGHDVYMIGALGAGKSTLISKMMKEYENKSKWNVKMETYPGTNAQVLEVPLSNSSFFYALPDLSLDLSVVSKVEKDVAKLIIPHKKVEITKFTCPEGYSIEIGCLSVIELIKGRTTSMKFYAAKPVEYKRVASSKATAIFEKNLKYRSLRPMSDHFTLFTDFDLFEYTMENDGKLHDISVQGFYTVSFVAQGQVVRIGVPKGTAIKESLSKIR